MTTSIQVEASQFWPITSANALQKSTYSTQADKNIPVDPVFFVAPIWAADQGLNLVVGAANTPWVEPIYFRVSSEIRELAALTKPGTIGVVRQVLSQTQTDVWLKDECTKLIVELAQGHIASVTQGERAPQMIIEGGNGRYERLGFTRAVLLADGTYEVSGFERGLGGSRQVHIVPDAKFMILNDAVNPQIVSENLIGQNLATYYFTDRHDLEGRQVNCFIAENIAASLAPIHLNIRHSNEGISINWQAQLSDDSGEWMYAEAEYGADFSHFNLNVKSGNTVIRNAQIRAERWVYVREEWERDRLRYGDEIAIEIAMVSRKFGPGDVARRIL